MSKPVGAPPGAGIFKVPEDKMSSWGSRQVTPRFVPPASDMHVHILPGPALELSGKSGENVVWSRIGRSDFKFGVERPF